MTVKERLIEFIKHKNLSVRKFESLCGLSFGYVNNMRVSIQPDKVMNIAAQFPELNTDWLLMGNGEMLKDVNPGTPESFIRYIRMLPLSAMGSSIRDFMISNKEGSELAISPVKDAKLSITITDEGMGSGYPVGSRIYIKEIDPGAFITPGNVYVVDTINETVIRVLNHSEKEGYYHCTSLSKDQERFAPFDLPKTAILGIYKILAILAMK